MENHHLSWYIPSNWWKTSSQVSQLNWDILEPQPKKGFLERLVDADGFFFCQLSIATYIQLPPPQKKMSLTEELRYLPVAPLVGFMISKRGGDEHLWVVILSGACLTALGLVLRHLGSIYRVPPTSCRMGLWGPYKWPKIHRIHRIVIEMGGPIEITGKNWFHLLFFHPYKWSFMGPYLYNWFSGAHLVQENLVNTTLFRWGHVH